MPEPVTTPSPGIFCSSMPKSVAIVLDEHVIFFEAAGIEQHATAARARSAGPWHAAPRCASRRRPAAPASRRFSSSSIVVAIRRFVPI